MEIQPVTISFDTSPAQRALAMLAEAALESPDIVKGIATLESPIFEASVDDPEFANPNGRNMRITIYPTDRLKQFLRGLGKLPRQT